MEMHLPPNCYRGAASADVETSTRALATMNAHWQMILRVEALAADGHEEPRTILADMPWTKTGIDPITLPVVRERQVESRQCGWAITLGCIGRRGA